MRRINVLTLIAVACVACAPMAGDPCSSSGSGTCTSGAEALFCEGGTFHAAACKGPGGCIANGSRFSCDISGDVAGDSCTPSMEGTAHCAAADSRTAFLCQGGAFVAQACASSCSTSAGSVYCR